MIFTVDILLLSVAVFPLLLAIALMLKPSSKTLILLAPLMALPALLIAILMPIGVAIEVPWLLLGSFVGFNQTAKVFLFFTAILWMTGGIYALGYFTDKVKNTKFFIWFLLAMAGNFGLIIAEDMILFYTFFTLMSLASYGLVVHSNSLEALRAGRIYIILVIIGEILLFAAFSMMIASAGSIEFSVVRASFVAGEVNNLMLSLLLLSFGIKAGIIGLHVWLPLAHPVAPTPASAILSGAMIATGLLGLIQVLPLGKVELPFWGGLMIMLGMVSTFYGVLVGLLQSNAKTVLAYSSISSMGIMIMAIGLGLIAPELWALILIAILVYVLQHGFAKAALFLSVGIFARPIFSKTTSKIRQILFSLALLVPVLSLIGAPLTSGFVAKKMLDTQVYLASSAWAEWVQTLTPWASLAASLLLARFLYLIWASSVKYSQEVEVLPPKTMWLSWLFLIVMVVLSPVIVFLLGIKTTAMADLISIKALINFSIILLAVILLSYTTWFITKFKPLPNSLKIPAGDMLIGIENYILPSIIKSIAYGMQTLQKGWQGLASNLNLAFSSAVSIGSSYIGEIDKKLKQWTLATILLLAMMLVFTLFIFLGGVSPK